MDLYPLVPPDLPRLAAQGNARLVTRGPRTVAEVLERARAEMAEEDRLEAYRNDPLAYLGVHRPRRRLIDVIRGRR